ncbi:MAG: hypothetical protein LV477_02595 [Candidatus Nitrosotalea sp.]|nr:hypothetical protein [Candidatus Nitrosotalea sp.]
MFEILDQRKSLVNFLWKSLPHLQALIITNNDGNLLEYRISEKYQESNLPSFEQIARKVSIRFRIVDFDTELGGLAMTINVFKTNIMLVQPLQSDHILILLIPKGTNVEHAVEVIKNVQIIN